MSWSKLSKNILKHSLFLILSVLIAHTAMAYLIGVDDTLKIVTQSPEQNWPQFIGLSAFTLIFYLVFAKFREQACIVVCPYGRLQGVLLVKDSILVAYDWIRGEPRGKGKRDTPVTTGLGDCIDCKLCVHVCPTGIDIRNGTQLECVNCTACMDACDEVMIKVNQPKGLIRYASYNSILNGVSKLINTRIVAYAIVLAALIGLLSFSLITRTEVETNVFKVSGTLFQRDDNGFVTNLYNVEFVNKTFDSIAIELRVISPVQAMLSKPDGAANIVPPGGMLKTIYFIRIPEQTISSGRTVVMVGVYHQGALLETVKIKFIGPVYYKTKPI